MECSSKDHRIETISFIRKREKQKTVYHRNGIYQSTDDIS